jgi:asparagine synthase (glutamine-hydrolysing)
MCGILAVLNNSTTINEIQINNSFNAGVNRGPESSIKKYIDDDVLMGFHRLAINGLDEASGQPLTIDNITLICNGEIYNYKELFTLLGVLPTTSSDCEVIIHLYARYGLEYTLQLLDGVFAFVLHDLRDDTKPILHVARDPFGVRPLYMLRVNDISLDPVVAFASELKVLHCLSVNDNPLNLNIVHVKPGTYMSFNKDTSYRVWIQTEYNKFYTFRFITNNLNSNIYDNIYTLLNEAVKKRVIGTSDRKIACLLSGGLDSSLITALVNKYYNGVLETYSIGMPGSEDVKNAEIVAKYLGTNHTSIIYSEEDFFNAIPEVIKSIESYDTTTVRASVGNYLLGKYIKANSDAKVIFNGDGSDEVTGGYLYFKAAPSDAEFDLECKRLLSNIYAFDVLRSDKCISSHGLEPRTPFLDRAFVDYYLSIPAKLRNTNKVCEKHLLRETFNIIDPNILPTSILWRKKEAFSDGVSSLKKSWFQVIEDKVKDLIIPDTNYMGINTPKTLEQQYYRYLYDSFYPGTADIVPYFWMPSYVNATDASARTLTFYDQ